MNKESKRESVIARLIANTRRIKRPDNLIKIAQLFKWLEKDLGGLKEVSKTIGISIDMIRQFLSVEKLCPEVQKLVKERKIDLINIVRYISGFKPAEQQYVANEVIAGQLSATDIRVLAPLKTSHPNLTIDKLVLRVQKSRDIPVYIAYFKVPNGFKNTNSLKKRFGDIVGKDEIMALTIKDSVVTLKLTSLGQKIIRNAAKQNNLTLRKFIDKIISI